MILFQGITQKEKISNFLWEHFPYNDDECDDDDACANVDDGAINQVFCNV